MNNGVALGEELRDEGIAAVTVPNRVWLDDALALFRERVPVDSVWIAPEVRQALCAAGLGEPTNPKAWGAFVGALYRRKLIEPTGQIRKSPIPNQHAHPYREFVRVA